MHIAHKVRRLVAIKVIIATDASATRRGGSMNTEHVIYSALGVFFLFCAVTGFLAQRVRMGLTA